MRPTERQPSQREKTEMQETPPSISSKAAYTVPRGTVSGLLSAKPSNILISFINQIRLAFLVYDLLYYEKNMEPKPSSVREIAQKLSDLDRLRTKYIFSILHGKSMIRGMPHHVYRRCGKKNCKCTRGSPHGPYAALAINRNGRQRIKLIRKTDAYSVLKKARRYRYFQDTLAAIRKINRETDRLLQLVRASTSHDYPDR